MPGKMVQYTGHASHEWTALQIAVGEAAAKIDEAEMRYYRAADQVDDYARRCGNLRAYAFGGRSGHADHLNMPPSVLAVTQDDQLWRVGSDLCG